MQSHSALTLERQIAAALDWWREAGVDLAYTDEPSGWLQPAAQDAAAGSAAARNAARPAADTPPPAPIPRIGGDRSQWPQDLAQFRAWWLAEPTLDAGGSAPRVAPRGSEGARLMVLVPMPEPDDRERLLAGQEGALVDNMLAAMGIGADAAYVAAALPRHMAEPDWRALGDEGLGAILLHHLALARPERLLVLGRNILPLLGHDPAQSPAAIKQTAIQGAAEQALVPTLAGFAPGRLLENARQRALLWRRWLDWTDEG